MATISQKDFLKGGSITVVGRENQQQKQNKPGIGSKVVGGVVNYAKNVAGDFKNRGQNIINSVQDAGNRKQSPFSAGIQTVGQVAGAAGGIISHAIEPAINKAADVFSNNQTFSKIANSKVGDSVTNKTGNAFNKYTEWARQHPEASRNLEAAVNVATLLAGEKPLQSAVEATVAVTKNLATKTATSVSSGISKGVTGTAEGIVSAGKNLKPAASGASRLMLGDDLKGAVDYFSKNIDNVNSFRSGGKTYQNIADTTTKAVKDFDNKSFQTFQKMKASLPEIKVPTSNVVGEVKKIVNKLPPLIDKEKSIVQGIMEAVSGNDSKTLKGLLDMRNRLDRGGFFRAGEDYINSNRFLTNVRNKINDMAITRATNYDKLKGTKVANQIRQGLQKASSDIQFVEKIKTNLLGSHSEKYIEQTASKIRQVIGKIDDPIEFEATKNLLKELEARTGIKITSDLEAAKVARIIEQSVKLKGGLNPLQSAGTLINKGVVKGVEILNSKRR